MNIGPILVIDDDLSFRQLVAQLLASRGYTVVHAVSAAEADEVMKENPPSMAIVDYRLPGRDGISWISSLRDSGSSLPVVFLSGTRCDQKMFNKLRSILRVALILQKPIVPELFLEQIDMVLPAPGKRTHEELTIPPAAILEEPVAAQGGEELHKQAAAPDVVLNEKGEESAPQEIAMVVEPAADDRAAPQTEKELAPVEQPAEMPLADVAQAQPAEPVGQKDRDAAAGKVPAKKSGAAADLKSLTAMRLPEETSDHRPVPDVTSDLPVVKEDEALTLPASPGGTADGAVPPAAPPRSEYDIMFEQQIVAESEPELIEQLRQFREKLEIEHALNLARADYARELPEKVSDMLNAIERSKSAKEDREALEDAVHKAHRLRGTAGSMGFTIIGEAAGRLEDLMCDLQPETSAASKELWEEIELAAEACLDAVKATVIESPKGVPYQPQPQRRVQRRVLLVGSSAELQEVASFLGESQIAETILADKMTTAVLKAKTTRLDALFFHLSKDIETDMFQIVQEIRLLPGCEALPVGIFCRRNETPPASHSIYGGISAVLQKPFNLQAIKKEVESLVSMKEPKKPHILLVDDDEVLANFIGTTLSGEGMVVRTLKEPIRTIDVVEEYDPDVVLLDVVMPGLSGFDICRALRAAPTSSGVGVLFLTAKSSAEGRAAAFRAGGDDFLTKPVLSEELVSRVKGQLDRTRAARERLERDNITGVLMRNAFQKELNKLLSGRSSVSVAAFEVDNFRQLGVLHGWAAEDQVLSTIGKLVQTRFRAEDLRGRWGDGGFVFACPNASGDVLKEAMDFCCQEIEQIRFVSVGGDEFTVKLSFAVAEYPKDGANGDDILNAVHKGLLAAARGKAVY